MSARLFGDGRNFPMACAFSHLLEPVFGTEFTKNGRTKMSIIIKVGEPHLTIHHGHGVLISDPDGSMIQPSQKGLFFRDTRLISGWRATAEGEPWILLNSANEAYCVARLVLTNPKLETDRGELQKHTLGFLIGREIGEGIHEDLDLSNYGKKTVHFNLEINISSDFADLFEVKGHETIHRSGIATAWSEKEHSLSHSYHHDGFSRGITVRVCNNSSRAAFGNGKIAFPITLDAGACWHACLLYEFVDGGQRFSAPPACHRSGADCE
jgi:glycogen debranching enzyme